MSGFNVTYNVNRLESFVDRLLYLGTLSRDDILESIRRVCTKRGYTFERSLSGYIFSGLMFQWKMKKDNDVVQVGIEDGYKGDFCVGFNVLFKKSSENVVSEIFIPLQSTNVDELLERAIR